MGTSCSFFGAASATIYLLHVDKYRAGILSANQLPGGAGTRESAEVTPGPAVGRGEGSASGSGDLPHIHLNRTSRVRVHGTLVTLVSTRALGTGGASLD